MAMNLMIVALRCGLLPRNKITFAHGENRATGDTLFKDASLICSPGDKRVQPLEN